MNIFSVKLSLMLNLTSVVDPVHVDPDLNPASEKNGCLDPTFLTRLDGPIKESRTGSVTSPWNNPNRQIRKNILKKERKT